MTAETFEGAQAFEECMKNFTQELNCQINDIKAALESHEGWEGMLYESFREKMMNEINELEKLSKKSSNIVDRLDLYKAIVYQIISFKSK